VSSYLSKNVTSNESPESSRGSFFMTGLCHSRREALRASVICGVAVYLAPLGSRAFASLFEQPLLTRPDWNGRDDSLKYRIDGTSKVMGEKVFARDIRARDMPHWPPQQSHALALRVTVADRRYAGFDLSALGRDLAPDKVVTAADLARDRPNVELPFAFKDQKSMPPPGPPGIAGL
jgi:hypothetical protein